MNPIIRAKMKAHHMLREEADIRVFQPVGKELSVDIPNRLIKFVATTEDVDCDRQVVRAAGARTEYFFKNRRIFVDHEYDIRSHVGTLRAATPWNGTRPTQFGAPDHNSWWVKVYILPMTGNPLGDDILTMAANGGVGTSIGYEAVTERKTTAEEKVRYGKGGVTPTSILWDWGWVEQTITAMPCNVNAQSIPEIDGAKAGIIEGLLTKGLIKPESAKLVGFPIKPKRRIICVAPGVAA